MLSKLIKQEKTPSKKEVKASRISKERPGKRSERKGFGTWID